MADRLRDRWRRTVSSFGSSAADFDGRVFDRLMRQYGLLGRHYHGVSHLEHCFRILDSVFPSHHSGEAELALWYHDAVYDVSSAENEEASAEMARQDIRDELGMSSGIANRVSRLILGTKHSEGAAWSLDQAVVLDVDLAILGEDEPTFWAYEEAVRKEYAAVPEDLYRAGRVAVLESFLKRDSVYRTPQMSRSRWEARARRNLEASLKRLRA